MLADQEGFAYRKGGNMYARVITVLVDVYRMDRAIEIYEESVLPAIKVREGGIGALLLVDRSSGRGISISLWEDKEALLAAQESGFMQEQIRKFTAMLIGTPDIEAIEVAIKDP
jgi:quinol monooxygenase YgiN